MDFEKVLRRVGLNVVSDKRSPAPGDFNPIGVMLHHTAGVSPGMVYLVKNGRSDLPGPLCNLLLRPGGKWVVITEGKANDSGMGSGRVLDEVRKGVRQSKDAAQRGLHDTVNGNAYFYDIEVEHVGTHGRYPLKQIDSLATGVAAILLAEGWTVDKVLHHRQWTRRKIDMSYREDIWKKIARKMRIIKRPTIKRGTTRARLVKRAKRRLVHHGAPRKGLYNVTLLFPTGKFDATMEAAVKKFQHDKKLGADGIIGTRTWLALERPRGL